MISLLFWIAVVGASVVAAREAATCGTCFDISVKDDAMQKGELFAELFAPMDGNIEAYYIFSSCLRNSEIHLLK